MAQEGEEGEDPPRSFFSSFFGVLRAFATICSVSCPPVPRRIISKLAFHPPPKGSGYTIHLDDDPKREIKHISEVVGHSFSIMPIMLPGPTDHYVDVISACSATTVRTPNGNDLVVAQFHTTKNPQSGLKQQVLLVMQPNSTDLGHFMHPYCVNFFAIAEWMEMDVYSFDYSGFGYSSGSVSEQNIYMDARAVYDYIRQTRPNHDIALMGYSIGTAAAIDLASCQPPRLSGVILIAPFTSGFRLIGGHPTKKQTCCLDPFTNSDKISNIDVPVLIIHGSDDAMIPLEHSMHLHSRLRHPVPPLIVHGADHQSVFNGHHYAAFVRMYRFLRFEAILTTENTRRMSDDTPNTEETQSNQ